MKKKTLGMLAAVGFVALAAPVSSVAQQETDAAVVRVPFAFVAGDAALTAGTYTVTADSADPTVVWFTSANRRKAVAVGTIWGNGNENDSNRASFRFRRYGHDAYVLSRVAMPGENAREVPLPKAQVERDLVKTATLRRDVPSSR